MPENKKDLSSLRAQVEVDYQDDPEIRSLAKSLLDVVEQSTTPVGTRLFDHLISKETYGQSQAWIRESEEGTRAYMAQKHEEKDVLLQDLDRQEDRILQYYLDQVNQRAMRVHHLAQARIDRENGGRDIVCGMFYGLVRQLEELEYIFLTLPE